jgi:crotonobetainyl-CoA:carnitine CoA-transferase CaiB-like acyl-CoA transferase
MVASPAMGAHTDALLAEAGYSPQAVADLKARGIAQ